MKELKLIVPDDKAQVFAKEMMELMRKHDVQVDGLDSLLPITERVKTYEDACKVLGIQPVNFHDLRYSSPIDNSRCFLEKDEVAYIKLKTIVEALNEGWKPNFTEDEYRYFPWFVFYTQEELDGMDEEDKKGIRVLGRSYNSASANAGVALSLTSNASSFSSTYGGGRLCFKNRALAEYAGQQFLAEYMDFIFCE
jgi:hypothetical protein